MKSLRLSPTSSSRRVLVLEFIRRYFRDKGSSPSYAEIAAHFMIPKQRVGPILSYWRDAGVLTYIPGRTRSIVLARRAACLSNSELELECRARGKTVMESPLPMLVEAFPVVPLSEGVTKYGLHLLDKLEDIE